MQDKFKRILFILLLLSAVFPLWAQSSRHELVEQKLSWESVDGAWGYEVTIRKGTEEILRQQIQEPEITLALNPGDYEFSIIVLNKFMKTVSTTPWKPLIIKEAFQPVVRRFSPEEVFENNKGNLTIQAEVYQAQEDTSFYLSDEEGKQIAGRQIQRNKESVKLEFPLKDLPPGIYTLSAVDSSGLADTSTVTVLTVLQVIEPEIRSVNNKRLVQKEVYPEIIVKGQGFVEGLTARVFFEDQVIIPYEIEWESGERVRIALITGMVTPGRYDLEFINPSGVRARKEKAFIIEKAPMTEIVQEVPPVDSSSVLGGYTIAINTNSEGGDFEPVPLGIGIKLRQDIVNRIFWRIPGLRALGVELGMDYTPQHYKTADFYYHQLYAGFHFYYRIPFVSSWSLMPRLGGGVTNLWVTDGRMGGETLQGDFGPSFTAALGVQKKYKNGVLLEFGFDIRYNSYPGGDMDELHPWIMGGYRF